MSMFSSISSRLAGRASDEEPESDDHSAPEEGAESRSEMLFRIQELTERNERLTLRFRDVVGAYKATLKEKEALEASVSALAESSSPLPTAEGGDDSETPGTDGDEAASSDGSKPAKDDEGAGKLRQQRQQLDALGRAMSTLTKEKSTMESRFQADKKVVADSHRAELEQLRGEHSDRLSALRDTVQELEEERDGKAETVERLTEQLRSGHEADRTRAKEWERVRKLHAKELEDVRRQREDTGSTSSKVLDLESRLQKAQDAELEALTQLSSGTTELKEKISALEDELDTVNKKALSAGSKADGKQVLVLKQEVSVLEKRCAKWQQQAVEAKAELAEAVKTAQAQITAAATKVSVCMSSSDEKTTETLQQRVLQENQIGELSAMVGKYEAARLKDSARIAELQAEMDELRDALREAEGAASAAVPAGGQTTVAARIQALEETVEKLQELLRKSNQRLLESQSMDEQALASEADGDGGVSEAGHRGETANQLYRVKQSEHDLRAQLKQLLHEKDGEVDAERQRAQARLVAEQAAAREKIDTLEGTHQRIVDEMSAKSARARERTLQLIDDRNDEVRRLRKLLGAAAPADKLSGTSKSSSDSDATHAGSNGLGGGGDGGGGGGEADSTFVLANRDSGPLLHAVLEQREKGKETASMRREIRELQGSVLDAHEKATLLEEQSNKLKEEIRRLERNIRREGANLEYLKNVLVKFMCKEIGQDQMLLAIATMLQFSPGELNDVKQKISAQSRTWWAGKRT
eukprot:m.336244 g.336244  ORF g.336244 m.336244 type:complete len:755 (-) comp27782_c0_seq1:2573-4837(-)